MRLTAACPEALLADAGHLAMCLAFSKADMDTYRGLNWQDAAGNLYAAASFLALDEWITAAQSTLARPAWDTEGVIDMAAAARAQAAMIFWVWSEENQHPPLASPTALTVIGGMEGVESLAAMGLTILPPPEIPPGKILAVVGLDPPAARALLGLGELPAPIEPEPEA